MRRRVNPGSWCLWMCIAIAFALASAVQLPQSSKSRIVVIGGGVGGLVSSALIAKANAQTAEVVLVEKNAKCGGRMNSESLFASGGAEEYRFDVGPSLLLLPKVYAKTFAALGANITDHVEMLAVSPFYRIFFQGEECEAMDLSRDKGVMRSQLESLEKGSFASYLQYLATAKDFLDFGLPTVIEEQPDWKALPRFLAACIKAFPLFSHQKMLDGLFQSDKIKAMLSFQDLYIGLSPYETPSVFSLLQALEYAEGIYYPKGGFGVVADALETLATQNGVNVAKNTECTGLRLKEDQDDDGGEPLVRITGTRIIQSDTRGGFVGATLDTDVVVFNADSPFVEDKFLPPEYQDRRASTGRPSCGVISLHFALDQQLSPLAHHSLFLSQKWKESWRVVEKPDESDAFDQEAFNFYVHAPSRTDPSACPAGHDAITVLVPVPPLPSHRLSRGSKKVNGDDGGDDDEEKEEAAQAKLVSDVRKAVLGRLQAVPGMPSALEQHIVQEKIRSPIMWHKEFALYRGSAFGLAHNLGQLSFLRSRLRHPNVFNLFRVGASTRPGNGVPLVMIGARLTSEAVTRSLMKD